MERIVEILGGLASAVTIFIWLGIKPSNLFWGSTGNDVRDVTLSRNKIRLLLVLPTIGLLLSTYGLYYSSFNTSTPSSYFLSWAHRDGGGVMATINTASMESLKRSRRLMIASVMIDPSVDVMNNSEIIKSRTYEIEVPIIQIDVFATPEFHQKEYLGQNIQSYLIDVPADFPIERMATLADAERLGGRILEHQGFTTARAVPMQQAPPSAQ